MNVLVTGANGFVGRALMSLLCKRGDFVRGIYSKEIPAEESGYECDLTCADSVTTILQVLKEVEWDVVVHLASVLCNEVNDGREVFETNLKMSWNMIEIARAIQPKELVHASSIAVYPTASGCFNEESLTRPSDSPEGLYGLSKICAENLFDHQLKNAGITVLHLRLAQVWGEGMRTDRIIPIMEDELSRSGKITVFGNGERVSNFIHIDKLVGYFAGLIGRAVEGGVYNVGDESLSYLELARRVASEQGADKSVIKLVDRGSRSRFEMDLSKLKEVLHELDGRNLAQPSSR